MPSFTNLLFTSAVLSLANAHGVILNAQGAAGPASVGFQVNPDIARNCTTINPCQQDATIIRDAEISANLVNECGRTELSGNIDVGENTENALAANAVTQVTSGSDVVVTIHQVNADGAGPYVCDLDQTSNSNGVSGQTPLEVIDNVPGVNGFSQVKAQQFNFTVRMPADMACTGASTGNVCTVRCRNNAVAGPFGGCFAVQQTDTTPKVNTPQNIATLQSLQVSEAQVLKNQADLPAAIAANQAAGADSAQQNAAAVNAILGISVTSVASPVQTPAVAAVDAGAGTGATTSAAANADATSAAAATNAGNSAATSATSATGAAATTAATATGATRAAQGATTGNNGANNANNNNNNNRNGNNNIANDANNANNANNNNANNRNGNQATNQANNNANNNANNANGRNNDNGNNRNNNNNNNNNDRKLKRSYTNLRWGKRSPLPDTQASS